MKKILTTVVELMLQAQTIDELDGEAKKIFVMKAVREILEYPDNIEDIIIEFIDIIIEVDKGKIKINDNVKKSILSPCFICHKKK